MSNGWPNTLFMAIIHMWSVYYEHCIVKIRQSWKTVSEPFSVQSCSHSLGYRTGNGFNTYANLYGFRSRQDIFTDQVHKIKRSTMSNNEILKW